MLRTHKWWRAGNETMWMPLFGFEYRADLDWHRWMVGFNRSCVFLGPMAVQVRGQRQ